MSIKFVSREAANLAKALRRYGVKPSARLVVEHGTATIKLLTEYGTVTVNPPSAPPRLCGKKKAGAR